MLYEACRAVRSQTCTLKSTGDPSNPTTYSAAGDTDWVSGALTNLAAAQAAEEQVQMDFGLRHDARRLLNRVHLLAPSADNAPMQVW